MKTVHLLVGLLFLFASCAEKKEETFVMPEKPANLIPEDKMIQVLADVHLLESAVSTRSPAPVRVPRPGENPQTIMIPQPGELKGMPYYDIFSKYGYTREQFAASFEWYATDPEGISTMYDEVIAELTRRQAKEQSGQITPPASDSANQ